MRGDGVGVGDIGEVSGVCVCSSRDKAGGDDGGGAGRECDAGMVRGFAFYEHDAVEEQGRNGVADGDGARGEHGACDVHWKNTGGAHGMRGDGVGVRDIGEVSGVCVCSSRDKAGCDDGGGAGRECD